MKKRRMPAWLGWTLALLVAAGFARLGFWQLARMHEKETWLASVQAVLAQRVAQPLALAADPARARRFDWAAGRGRFAESPPVLLDNQSRDDRAGVRAYRVFLPDAQATPLLVELGWLPLPGDRALPRVAAIPGEVEVRGLLLPPPSPGLIAATASREPNGSVLTTTLDAPGLPALLGIAKLPPRVLRLDPAMRGIGYARDLDVLPNTLPPSRHLGYAVQWFALSLAVLATAAVLTFRKPRA
jgi:cytochrome oxidase assembly protein ShyY1